MWMYGVQNAHDGSNQSSNGSDMAGIPTFGTGTLTLGCNPFLMIITTATVHQLWLSRQAISSSHTSHQYFHCTLCLHWEIPVIRSKHCASVVFSDEQTLSLASRGQQVTVIYQCDNEPAMCNGTPSMKWPWPTVYDFTFGLMMGCGTQPVIIEKH